LITTDPLSFNLPLMKIVQTAERNSGNELSDNVIHHRHLIAYDHAAKLISGRVLEIGSGEGYGIRILSPHAKEYFAIDKHQTPVGGDFENVVFKQCHVPPLHEFADNSFDFVVTFQVIEHIKDDLFFLQEIYRVLKPGGTLIMTTPNKHMSLTRNPWHIREYTPEQMKKLLGQVFPGAGIKGVYGNEKVLKYHEENRRSVKRFTRWDILNMQFWLPRWMLQIPYDLANRMNRRKLHKANTGLVSEVVTTDFFIDPVSDTCLDFFCIAKK
jgi:SAM-dependent methyltransferase